ncbi:conserved hypothetical protein [Desulforapulum autotrophicum HRM2]|uniref:Uncharacterized protein n=1 Tax=Desulforapulum autotrophicum (strain ATCC 43914 / DSM 3382 / VKM B-1955 / HRM2) TaxID=177437 RepID=C0QD16_DESAH|nr:EAL domain-containing protein [Desulforapulum autotrophicum]ACN17248.1 conserved hypothetical protein [Desulforapulum autotrophicum HRM2]
MSNHKFFSLKWKFIFLISFTLVLLQGYLTGLSYIDAQRAFLDQGEKAQTRYFHIAKTVINNSSKVLELFAESIFPTEASNSSSRLRQERTIALLDENWLNWQFIWGLETAVLTDHEGKKIKEWGRVLKDLSPQIQQVLKKEEPLHTMACEDECYTTMTIPVISSFKAIGTLTLGRSLADGMIEFQNATQTDMVILTRVGKKPVAKDAPYQLSAMTHAAHNTPLLQALKEQHTMDELVHKNIIFHHGKRFYNIQAHAMDNIQNPSSLVLIIDDITAEYKEMHHHLARMVLTSLLGLFSILLVLSLLVHALLKRIATLSSTLPLLARHEYQKVRQVLNSKKTYHRWHDEVDNLIAVARDVTDQLEALKNETQTQTLLLTKKSQDLKREKEFIERLVQTAPILIMTQTCSGEILFVNNAALVLHEVEKEALVGHSFDDFFSAENHHHHDQLMALRQEKEIKSIQYDADMISSSGITHAISWFHSTLYPQEETAPLILTIGLDITDRKRAEEQMVWLATHDHLTNLSNLRHFNHEFERIIDQAKRYDEQVALFYLDLDQFKIINDTQGHHRGDVVLQTVAMTLKRITRKSDLICRIGGDEFTLLMPNATGKAVLTLAKKINQALGKTPVEGMGHNFKISASIGIAIFPQHGTSIHDLLSNADLAMYHAKKSGYGQFHVYSAKQQYQVHLTQRMYWKNVLEEAIENDRFVLYFQPILDLKTDRISHYECLIRLISEQGSVIPPGEFIEYAEVLGLIGHIDRIVMAKAIAQHLEFNKRGMTVGLSINLSGRSLNDRTVSHEIRRLLTLPHVNPEKIIFEITETAAISNFPSARTLINEVKELGCRFAIDDFGVGFSSFQYLKDLAVDYVKIDGSFIRKIDTSHGDRIFVKSMSEIAHALGKKTIAEFVENEAIVSVLREYEIDYAQGYHIGKPQPIEHLNESSH